MKLNWGARIAILYCAFVVLIVTLVVLSSRQKIDLVADDYYKQELKYQTVINAKRNAQQLSEKIKVSQNGDVVQIALPKDFKGKVITGKLAFYSPVDSKLDRTVPMEVRENVAYVGKGQLHKAFYKLKISWESEGVPYYDEESITIKE